MEKRNGMRPAGFILAFGVVSMLVDIVYEGALAVQGPLLASLGASAALVGVVSGLGEATSLAGRLFSGPAADKTGRYWVFAIAGYATTILAVPTMGFVGSVIGVSILVVVERFGKSLRTPSRDAMLSHAAAAVGRGRGFAIHEMLDQVGAVAGPLIVSFILTVTNNSYGPALGVLVIPGLMALCILFTLKRKVPDARVFEDDASETEKSPSTEPATQDVQANPSENGHAVVTASGKLKLPGTFWAYTIFCGLALAGVGTFGVMSYHMITTGLVADATVPILYAIAMAVDAVFALVTGSLYDKISTKALYFLPVVSALIPCFMYTWNLSSMITGVVLWGAGMGIQESTMRAAVADMVPSHKRATAYGYFSVAVGVGALVGASIAGFLYDANPTYIMYYSVAMECVAFALLFVIRRTRKA